MISFVCEFGGFGDIGGLACIINIDIILKLPFKNKDFVLMIIEFMVVG
jgi:hypothetical protein